MAARSGDPFAVQRLLGHVDLTMATRYVQDVSEQTDRVIGKSRKYVIRGEDGGERRKPEAAKKHAEWLSWPRLIRAFRKRSYRLLLILRTLWQRSRKIST
jgi:integrase